MSGTWNLLLRQYLQHIAPAMCLGFALDFAVGDPVGIPHPVRWMGRWISFLEQRLRNLENDPKKQRRKGALLVMAVLMPTAGISILLFAGMEWLHPLAGLLVETVLCAYMLAARDLARAGTAVFVPLQEGDLSGARKAVSMIVGRDTDCLSEAGICRAAVESVAESASDGVIAPLFYMALLGPVGAVCYKAVNTMDSMIAYRNERYRYFGTAAARLDDVANYVPARIGAQLMIAAAFFLRLDARNAFRIYRRDRRKHASPNAAQMESTAAGALRIQLAGNASYFGTLVEKPTIGDPDREIEAEDILRGIHMMYLSSVLALFLFLCFRIVGEWI